MSKEKIIDYFLKQAETGNWDKIKYPDVEKKLNLKKYYIFLIMMPLIDYH